MTKRIWTSAVIVFLAPLTAAPTCSDKKVQIGEDQPGEDDDAVSLEHGAWGRCSGLSSDWGCPGNGMFGSEDTETCDSDCTCVLPCHVDDDCPAPDTGTSVPKCGHLGTADSDPACVLPCGEEETCPDGMSCQEDMSPDGPICVWHDDGAMNLRCDPDGCAQYETPEDCITAHDGFPLDHDLVCVWATETIIPGSSDTCESVYTEKKCIAAQREPGNDFLCDNTAPCGDQAQVVYWQDLGGGDLSLLTVDGCDRYPYAPPDDYEVCEFGDPTLPLKCDCACEDG